jgi:gluconate 2-dehydrogenase gamma chain
MPMDDEARAPQEEAAETGLLSRKTFLGRTAVAAGSVALAGASQANASQLVATAKRLRIAHTPVALTTAELATLQAVLGQLFPNGHPGPGAVEMGVDVYIDRSLAGSYKSLLPVYQALLPMFDKAAVTLGAASFAALSSTRQIKVLQQFEAGHAPGASGTDATGAAGSFQLLLEHMREGLFGDPMYGGNRNRAGWKLIGYPDIKITWTAADQKPGTALKPTGKTARSYGGKPYDGPST